MRNMGRTVIREFNINERLSHGIKVELEKMWKK